jgi:hypothetical protein
VNLVDPAKMAPMDGSLGIDREWHLNQRNKAYAVGGVDEVSKPRSFDLVVVVLECTAEDQVLRARI